MGHLAHEDVMVGVVFGFLRDISVFQERFGTDKIIFCFDHGQSNRKEIDSTYKANRTKKYDELDDEQKEAMEEFRNQVQRLRTRYLPFLGFKNVFFQYGYEADDVIASIVHELHYKDEAVIISADQDLYQLLGGNVSMHNPTTHKTMTYEAFKTKWDVPAAMWSHVKAWAGCTSDNIQGVPGIGEITAAKWVSGSLKKETKAYQKISDNIDIFNRNIKLVTLPLDGTKKFKTRQDKVTEEKWVALADKLGMKSIRNKIPLGIKGSKSAKKKGFGF
jgi:5'-3' exonuclease